MAAAPAKKPACATRCGYLSAGRELSVKVSASLLGLCDQAVDTMHWEALAYFHAMLDKHLDLVERRLLQAETIPAAEKVFSLFEPHTEWIQRQTTAQRRTGPRLLIAADQHNWCRTMTCPWG